MLARIGGLAPPAAPIYAVDDAFADLFEGNELYAAIEHEVAASGVARRGLAIVTCIDSRIDPLAVFGLVPGDAKILRNAGARVTDDVLRTLALATALLGVTRIAVVQHTDCRMTSSSDADLRAAVVEATGVADLQLDPMAITDQAAVLRSDVDRLLDSPLVPDGTVVAGLVYQMHSGRLTTLVAPRAR
jgi:carbonic anhydrase